MQRYEFKFVVGVWLFASRQHLMHHSASTSTNLETQPLLGVEHPSYHNESTSSRANGDGDEVSVLVSGAAKARSWSTVAFQGAIVLLSLIVVALFIQGFIGTDDI